MDSTTDRNTQRDIVTRFLYGVPGLQGRPILATSVLADGRDIYPVKYWRKRGNAGTHYCAGTLGDAKNEAGNPTRTPENTIECVCAPFDDIGTKAQAPKLKPSVIIQTRPGNFTYVYAYDRPCPPELHERIMASAIEAGFCDPNCGDRERLFRMPGSKPPMKEHEAVLMAFEDIRYNPYKLIELLDIAEVNYERVTREPVRKPAPPGHEVHDVILEWLDEQGMTRRREHDGWVQIQCPWHHLHSDPSKDIAKYRPATELSTVRAFHCHHTHEHGIMDLLEEVSKRGGPYLTSNEWTPERRLSDLFDLGVRPSIDEIPQVAGAAHRDLLEEMIEDLVLFVPKNKIISLKNPKTFIDVPGMRGKLKHHDIEVEGPRGGIRRISHVDMWLSDERKKTTEYVPGMDPRLPTGFHDGVVNLYRPFTPIDTDTKPDTFLRFVQHVAPEDSEWLLDWIACKVQRPWERLTAVVSYTPTFGTGRNSLMHIIRLMLGEENCAAMSAARLFGDGASSFNSHLLNLMVTVGEVEEGATEDHGLSRAIYNKLKELVDPNEGWFTLERKGIDGQRARTFMSLFIATNAGRGLPLEKGERRFSVIRGNDQRLPASFEPWLTRVRDDNDPDELSAIHAFLMKRDISHFRPNMARETKAKQDMIEEGKNEVDQAIEALIGEYEVVTTNVIVDRIRASMMHLATKDLIKQVRGWVRNNTHPPRHVETDRGRVKIDGEMHFARVLNGAPEPDRHAVSGTLEAFIKGTQVEKTTNVVPFPDAGVSIDEGDE